MAIFPGEPELAGFIEAKDDGSGGDNWSSKSCKAPVKWSTSTKQQPIYIHRKTTDHMACDQWRAAVHLETISCTLTAEQAEVLCHLQLL